MDDEDLGMWAPERRYCVRCGHELGEGAGPCRNCGYAQQRTDVEDAAMAAYARHDQPIEERRSDEPGAGGTRVGEPTDGDPRRSGSNRTFAIVAGVAVLLVALAAGGIVLSRQSTDSPTSVAASPTEEVSASAPAPSPDASTPSSDATSDAPSTPSPTGEPSNSGTDLRVVQLQDGAQTSDGRAVAQTLDAYFTGINNGDFQGAWQQLDPAQQARSPLARFRADTAGTADQDVVVRSVSTSGDGSDRARVTFTSTQPGDKGSTPGETCTNWSITYRMVPGDGAGGWLIADTPVATHDPC